MCTFKSCTHWMFNTVQQLTPKTDLFALKFLRIVFAVKLTAYINLNHFCGNGDILLSNVQWNTRNVVSQKCNITEVINSITSKYLNRFHNIVGWSKAENWIDSQTMRYKQPIYLMINGSFKIKKINLSNLTNLNS